MREERVVIGDVPALVYTPQGAVGLLLLGHGGGHGKDAGRFVALARRYAEQVGLAVVCMDAVDHGERAPVGATADIPREWHSSATLRMVRDWQIVAEALSSIGPPVAYVGFSMGVLFGLPTVAAIPSIERAVFVAGGVPTGAWIDDPPLLSLLEQSAGQLESVDLLMLNTTDDELFSVADSTALFDAIQARSKQQRYRDGGHDDWSDEMIVESIDFFRRGMARAVEIGTSQWTATVQPVAALVHMRSEAERLDQVLAWNRSDEAFFAAGACHILAFRFVETSTEDGLEIVQLRPRVGGFGSHVYVRDRDGWAFDFNGWSAEPALIEVNFDACVQVVPSWTCDRVVLPESLARFCDSQHHRHSSAYAFDPTARADAFISTHGDRTKAG